MTGGSTVERNRGAFVEEMPKDSLGPADVGRKSKPLRRDIQGLRAVAVVAVVLDHLFAWPSGGFIGVDIFFVISGFLITGLLIREWQRSGRISFVDFYRRRAKRILPAALLVTVTTVVAAFFLFSTPRFHATVVDSVWATLFSANWRFLLVGSDYFQADGPVSPLRHYWSLSVEEQFYFVWPWIMLVVLTLLSRKGLHTTKALRFAGIAILAISCISFAWAFQETQTNPGAAYYSTFSRTWELGIGAVLAFAVPTMQQLGNRWRPILANLGVIGIAVSLFVVSPTTMFPAPGALLPVLSTALVIGAGSGGAQSWIGILTNRVSQYLGNISYSLYLWHFPVIIFLPMFVPPASKFFFVCALVLMLGLASYSYRLVEDPIRKSGWLSSKKAEPSRGNTNHKGYFRRSFTGLAVFLIVVVGSIGLHSKMFDSQQPIGPAAEQIGAPLNNADGPAVQKIQKELAESATATSWPVLTPTIEEAISTDPYPDGVADCASPGNHSADQCTFGPKDAKKHAILVGDSISLRWAIPLTKIYAQDGWNIRVMGRPGCPFNDYPIAKSADEGAICTERKVQAVESIQDTKPDLVIVGNTMVPERMSTTGALATPQDWQAGMESILHKIAGVPQIVILSPPPFDKDIRECYSPVKGPQDCLSQVTKLWVDISSADAAAAKAVGGIYIDTRALYCTPEGMCPAFAAGMPTKKDHTHMTMAYAYHIQDGLEEMLVAKKVNR